ncbi:albusnodin/ikarugamycin family macrolactam cyclase [Wenjunlia tyrosinilytica]|uniref:albusnodin/ikarugamycin family macrolactam cyclase n=1 Tax=Wenjunlia tyrosinilytica TaxID=1544741 RepID=UPI001662A6C0|nr:albusnodin/ikarugamycin family macrolactam cyclase [Wenjunlia tyrosinilytica]
MPLDSAGHSQVPELIGSFPRRGGSVPPSAARLGTGGHDIWSLGQWREGELRSVSGGGGTVVTIGQCLISDQRMRQDVHRALETGRTQELTRWPGSHLCLVLRENDLTAYVDLAGQYPLYYRHGQGCLRFGTRPTAVADAAGVARRPDVRVLAARIFCPAAPELIQDGSGVEGVRRLGGGDALRVTADGSLSRWTYEPLLPDERVPVGEAAEALGEALETAVRLRATAGRALTADFSGGLDSTSLAFLALRHLAGPLDVLTYHRCGTTCDDLEYAERYARLDERLRREVITGTRETLSFQGLERAAPTAEPDPGAASAARTRLRLRGIAGLGGEIHLGGEGGDALLVPPPAYLADLARPGRLRRLGHDSRALARSRHESPLAVALRAAGLSRTTMATALRRLADRLESPRPRDLHWLDAVSWCPGPGPEVTWLTPSMRGELAELARSLADARKDLPRTSPGHHAALGELRTSGTVQRQLSDAAREFGVWPQAPFLDGDVIRACLTLPPHRRAAPPAFKPLLVPALSGRVPAQVLTRRTKGDYSDEDHLGARAASGALRALLEGSRLAELGVVEPGAVAASLERARMGLRTPFPALNRLLGAEVWLRSTAWH